MAILVTYIQTALPTIQATLLNGIHLICVKYVSIVAPYKDLLTKLQANPQLKEGCMALLDLIEGRRLGVFYDLT